MQLITNTPHPPNSMDSSPHNARSNSSSREISEISGISEVRPHLRPHLLQEPSSDSYTRTMHSKLSTSVQTFIRDKGIFRFIFDKSVNCIAVLKALTDHSIASNFMVYSNKVKTTRYGPSDYHIIEHIDISDFNIDDEVEQKKTSSFPSKPSRSSSRRVLVFVHGGAWGSGRPWMYRLTAVHAAMALGCTDVCLIGYPVYPESRIKNQVDAIETAIGSLVHFLHIDLNIHPVNYILMGHSSGANISALVLLRMAQSKLCFIDYFVALAGVYDVSKHFAWERNRGVHLISPMAAAAANDHKLASPAQVIELLPHDDNHNHHHQHHENSLLRETNSVNNFFPKTLIIHGIDDNTVPVSESIEFSKSLMRRGIDTSTAFPAYDHMNPITDLIDSSSFLTSPTGLALRYYKEHTIDAGRGSEIMKKKIGLKKIGEINHHAEFKD